MQLDLVAGRLARQSGDEMYEHLSKASKHQLVDRRGRFFLAQPLPIAAYLGARRIDLLRAETILHFIEEAPKELVLAFFRQWRYFDLTRNAVAVAAKLLGREGLFGSLDALSSEFGAQCLDALSHVAPDTAAKTIQRVFGELPLETLRDASEGRRNLVWTLQKLVFRRQSFRVAARLLMRLAAAETEDWSNNATGLFKQLLQLELSGTEVEPAERFAVIDEGIESGDERIIAVCIEALSMSLSHRHFSRTGGAEEIGSQPPLRDWHAKNWDEVFDFHRRGLATLERIRDLHNSFERRCEEVFASNLRGMICEPLADAVEATLNEIAKRRGIWLEGLEAVGQWLYFDRKGYPESFQKRVRALYDNSMPSDLVNLALLYTKFWSSDLYDPDLEYERSSDTTDDFEYSTRKAKEVAALIALDGDLVVRAVREMVPEKLNNAYPFAYELAKRISDPLETFKLLIEVINSSVELNGVGFVKGMLGGIDDRDSRLADECVSIALACEALAPRAIEIRTAVKISEERLKEIVESVKDGTLAAADCVYLSYGQGLTHLNAEQIFPLIDQLAVSHEGEGAWSTLEIISMYQHGRRTFDNQLLDRAKSLLVSPTLLANVRRANRDGYLFESLVQAVHKHGGLDDNFASELSAQFVRLCQLSDSAVVWTLDDPARKLIRLLVTERPLALWKVVTQFVEGATRTERQRLNRLIGPSRHDGDNENGAGTLYGIPEEACFEWGNADPATRAPFLCAFYPLFEKDTNGKKVWHPAMQRLAARYGEQDSFCSALDSRLHVGSWSGSLIPYLEAYFDPLETWYHHTLSKLSRWARDKRRALDDEIAQEKKHEEEEVWS